MNVYLFIPGSDACGICQAMEGRYDHEPARPHPNCHCQIKEFKDSGWHCRGLGSREIHNNGDGTIDVTQGVTVACCCDAGSDMVIEEEISVTITSEAGWAELSQTIEETFDNLESTCEDCPVA